MLQTRQLSFAYTETVRFSFPDISLEPQEHLLILGESGKGKTTLLHLLAGLLTPHEGQVIVDGCDITTLPEKQKDLFRGKNIGVIYQRSHFVQSLTIQENLLLAQYFSGESQDKGRVNELMNILGLQSKLRNFPRYLSQGEQQRVAIARSVLNTPKIILADEPTSSLDDKNCEGVLALLLEQASSSGASLIVVTHDQRVKNVISNKLEL